MPKKVSKQIIVLLSILAFSIGKGVLYAQTITRGPYLQQLNQNGVIIRWRTDLPTISLVQVSTKLNSLNEVPISKTYVNNTVSTEHIIQLTGLEASTVYNYTVGNESKVLAFGEDFYFVTAPASGDTRPINIWAMGDFGDDSKEVYRKNQAAVKEQYLKNKSKHTDLWLWLGDNAYCCGTDIEYQRQVFDFYGSNILGNTVFFPVPGNHEYLETATAQIDKKITYFDIINVPTEGQMGGLASGTKEYYSYNYGNIHFVALDSYGLDEGKYRLYDPQSRQYKWLINDLEVNKGKSLWTVITFHHPPYTKRSHDSNSEPELVAIRERLVPIFDKYKVDLVLNGHSHSYERSYLMKAHTGHSTSFDMNAHVVQKVNGKYETKEGSQPIINKDEGTIYCVIGSAGRLDWNGDPNPHPSSVYSNISIGGSLLFTINDNRLDARWISSDGVVRDNFTVFKNVNKIQNITAKPGQKVRLNASWKGSHLWSNGAKNQSFIEFLPQKDTLLSVVDSLGFLKDNFQISISAQPTITAELLGNPEVCAKSSVSVAFSVKNTQIEKWNYRLELSDTEGSFTKASQLAESSKSPFQVILPDTLKEGKNYRFRVRPNSTDYFEEIPSKNFTFLLPASLGFVGNKVIPFDTTLTLNLRFTGTPPFTYKISSLPENTAQTNNITFKLNPVGGSSYVIEKVSNKCGAGSILAENTLTVLAPLEVEETNKTVDIFPNPTAAEITIENHATKPFIGTLTLKNTEGKQLLQRKVSFSQQEKLSLKDFPSGIYLLILQSPSFSVSRKIIKN